MDQEKWSEQRNSDSALECRRWRQHFSIVVEPQDLRENRPVIKLWNIHSTFDVTYRACRIGLLAPTSHQRLSERLREFLLGIKPSLFTEHPNTSTEVLSRRLWIEGKETTSHVALAPAHTFARQFLSPLWLDLARIVWPANVAVKRRYVELEGCSNPCVPGRCNNMVCYLQMAMK